MKRFRQRSILTRYFLSASCAVLSVSSIAQTNYNIGSGTTTNLNWEFPAPFGDYYESQRQQFLYTVAEATAAGMTAGNITALKWNVINLNGAGLHDQFTLKIGTTTAPTLALTGWESGATTVYGPANYQPVMGVNTFTFPTPFAWDGMSNIIIEVCGGNANNAATNDYSYNPSVAYSIVPFNGSRTLSYDDWGNVCGNNDTFRYHQNATRRPNITIVMGSGSTACQAPTGVNLSSITATSAQASWSAPAGVTSFQYVVDQSATAPSGTGTLMTGTSVSLNSLAPGTSYYLHVRSACSGSSYSTWTNTSFTTSTAPCAAPASISASAITNTSATISWAAVTGASAYEYALGTSATPPVSGTLTTTPSVVKTGLTNGTNYYALVRTKCGTTSSSWATKTFSTITTGISEVTGKGDIISISPNPATNTISLRKADDKEGKLIITDVSGRMLKELQVKEDTATINLSGMTTGMYFIRYSNGERSQTIKLLKL
jgi:hypothetical protein